MSGRDTAASWVLSLTPEPLAGFYRAVRHTRNRKSPRRASKKPNGAAKRMALQLR
jgi:hypothetical protein